MIHFICALKCEARSLIKHYQLKHDTGSRFFPLYINHDKQISLSISGVGKINAAATTAFTHAFLQSGKHAIWLNVGVAGHKELKIGEITLAHKIIDQATNHSWYPQIIFSPPCQTMEVLNCDHATIDHTNQIFEMEAAGFYATACRFATSELIHVVKIISDNKQQTIDKISEILVNDLIKNKISIIDQITSSLLQLAKDLEDPDPTADFSYHFADFYEQMINQWRFTHAERERLKTCLSRWHVLCPHENPINYIDKFCKSWRGKEIIDQMTKKLDAEPINF